MSRIQPTSILYSTHKNNLQYPCRLEDAKYIKGKKHTHGNKCIPFISKALESSSKNFNVHSLRWKIYVTLVIDDLPP